MGWLSLKALLVSTGVLFMAFLFKLSDPLVVYFSAHQAPLFWSSFVAWLKPPYLYVIINCIIITIAASSRFHHKHDGDEDEREQVREPKTSANPMQHQPDQYDYPGMKISTAEIGFGNVESPVSEVVVYEQREEKDSVSVDDKFTAGTANNGSVEVEDKYEDEFVISKSTWMPPKRMESSENLAEMLSPANKPLVSARLSHRQPVRASPEGGRALRVSKPKRHETLENTWKTITEGRAMPLTRYLKKSDTWENHGRHINTEGEVDPRPQVKKSETFKDRTNYQRPPVSSSPTSGGKLRKEPSLSQDELNRRVEAFIKKFNEEMRLQRQESLNQYKGDG